MGFRVRKSVNLGGARINLSKSGVGFSVGGKGARFTKKSNGGYRSTFTLPGTGLSYVKETGSGRKRSSAKAAPSFRSSSYTGGTERASDHSEEEKPLILPLSTIETLNDAAFSEYSRWILDYSSRLSPDADPVLLEEARSAVRDVNQEISRRSANGPKSGKTSPKKPSQPPTYYRKKRGGYIFGIVVAAIMFLLGLLTMILPIIVVFGLFLIAYIRGLWLGRESAVQAYLSAQEKGGVTP